MAKYIDAGDIDLDEEEIYLKDGSRLTEARAEELGQEIADRAFARRGGRPSLTGGDLHSPRLSARVPQGVHDQVKARAEAEGKRISQVVRDAIEEYLARGA